MSTRRQETLTELLQAGDVPEGKNSDFLKKSPGRQALIS